MTNTNNLTLWYQNPAEEWTDALPVGNGRLGAMVFGGVERERLQLNEETLAITVSWIIPFRLAFCSSLCYNLIIQLQTYKSV